MAHQFQFHYGSIRTGYRQLQKENIMTVSIPLWFDQNTHHNNNNNIGCNVSIPLWFDQNLVRESGKPLNNWFQFHYGSIRTDNFDGKTDDVGHSFNSTMVRLEPPCHYLRVPYYNKPLPTLQPLFLGKLEITSFFLQIHSKYTPNFKKYRDRRHHAMTGFSAIFTLFSSFSREKNSLFF